MARKIGLRAGWSLDLITTDVDGRAWDFNSVEMWNRAARRVLQDRPLLLIGSPMCTVYSTMNDVNHARMSEEDVGARSRYARKHVEFSVNLNEMQVDAGRDFLHEHPHRASPWQETCIKDIMKREGVLRVAGDQCMYGLKAKQ